MSYFGLGNVYWTFNLLVVFCLFDNLEMFYPPKGLCKAENRRRSNCFYLCFIVLGNVYWTFNLQGEFAFLEPSKCFIPQRDSAKQSPKQSPMGSILIFSILLLSEKGIWHFQNHNFQSTFLKSWKCFIPRRDSANAEPNGVHFDSFHFNCGLRRVFDTFKITSFRRLFWNPENVLFDGMGWMMGWMDGMDGTEYQKCPLIFFILCEHLELIYIYLYTK